MSGIIVLILRLLLAIALYAFLGWAIYTLWRGLKSQASELMLRTVPRINLTVRSRGGFSSIKLFDQQEITIGRDPECDLHLDETIISARHARLRYHHNQWWLEDLESKNGTRLNKHVVNIPTVVTSGDEIVCGKTKIVVKIE